MALKYKVGAEVTVAGVGSGTVTEVLEERDCYRVLLKDGKHAGRSATAAAANVAAVVVKAEK